MRWIILLLVAMSAARAEQPAKRVLDQDVVKIAVIDTGFDTKSTWENILPRKPVLCDGRSSINFVDKTTDKDGKEIVNTDVMDNHGHGTHIVGLIAQYAGEAQSCFYIYKYYYEDGVEIDNLKRSLASIRAAIEADVDIINYSGGGLSRSDEECAVVKAALNKGIIFVAAAGNERSDLSKRKYFPAMCDPRVVVVGAKDKTGFKASFTNYSKSKDVSVKLEAGENVFSTFPGERSGQMSGSSQATAIMTGKLANHLYIMRKSEYGRYLIKKAPGWAK